MDSNHNQRAGKKPRFNLKILRRKRLIVLFLILTLGLIVYASYWAYQQNQKQRDRMLNDYPIHGVTINQDNGTIDFQQLQNQKISYVYINATSGATYFDDSFNGNFNRAQGSSLAMGAIHTFSFSSSARRQFEFFQKKVGSNNGNLPICIDVNYYGKYKSNNVHWNKQGANIKKLMSLFANYYASPVIVRTSFKIYRILDVHYIKESHFWIADKIGKARQKNIDFIDFDDNRSFKIDGSEIQLDESFYNGNRQSWNKNLNHN